MQIMHLSCIKISTIFKPIQPSFLLSLFTEAPVGTSVKRLKRKLGWIGLEIVLILMQDRCTVCMKRTICSEIKLDTPDGTPR